MLIKDDKENGVAQFATIGTSGERSSSTDPVKKSHIKKTLAFQNKIFTPFQPYTTAPAPAAGVHGVSHTALAPDTKT